MASAAEHAAMLRAVDLALRGRGRTSPNPPVGAVVLDPQGRVVGEGWHAYAGGPHAEVTALGTAGRAARGGTAVITLEPCAHDGRTPPCTDALLAAGVARVVIGVRDPNAVAAGGADVLTAAGVEVEVGVLPRETYAAAEPWLVATRLGRPFVTLKFAATLDGRVAADDGSSQWITSAAARADAHLLRAEVDAIAVGVSTVLADDPRLTARDEKGRALDRQPLRVVVDSQGRTPPDAKVVDGSTPTLVATTEAGRDALRAVTADVAVLPTAADGHTDVPALLAELHRRGVRHLLVEGGPKLSATVVDLDLADAVVAYLAPALMGSGRAAIDGGAGTPSIGDLARYETVDVRRVGPDVRLRLRRCGD